MRTSQIHERGMGKNTGGCVVLAVLMLSFAFTGCLKDEETEPPPEVQRVFDAVEVP